MSNKSPLCPMMVFADWGDGNCSFFATDCPDTPSQYDGLCTTPLGSCTPTPTNCIGRKNHPTNPRIGHGNPTLTEKRVPHKKPTLKNPNKLITKELDDQIAKFEDKQGNVFFVELWVYKVERKKEGDKEAQFAVMGVGQQINETQLEPTEPIILLKTTHVKIDSTHKRVVWIDLGAITYQVVLKDEANDQ